MVSVIVASCVDKILRIKSNLYTALEMYVNKSKKYVKNKKQQPPLKLTMQKYIQQYILTTVSKYQYINSGNNDL